MTLPHPSRSPSADAPSDRDDADVGLVVTRVGHELDGLASAVVDLQRTLGPLLERAAAHDPSVVLQAQTLDLVAQSLEGLSALLTIVGTRSLAGGRLPLEELEATLKLQAVANRVLGRAAEEPELDLDLELF